MSQYLCSAHPSLVICRQINRQVLLLSLAIDRAQFF
jgi:hypothetical protein